MTYVAIAALASALAALAFALYSAWSANKQIVQLTTDRIADGKALIESERNGLTLTKQRDSEHERADKAEAELAARDKQLASTQAALVAADKESTEHAADSVRDASDPLRALNSILSPPAAPDVPAAGPTAAGHGDQGKPAV